MVRYLLKRLGRGILTILLSVTLVFFIVRAMPLQSRRSDGQSPDVRGGAAAGADRGVRSGPVEADPVRPLYEGIASWQPGKQLCQANSGFSILRKKLPWTLLLLAAVMLIVILIGISVGLYAAAHKGKFSDRVISVLVTMGISVFIPFMAFLLLYIFSFKLKLLPTGGAYTPPKGTGWSYYGDVAKHLILPAIALSITNLANAVLYTRNSMIDVLHEGLYSHRLRQGK